MLIFGHSFLAVRLLERTEVGTSHNLKGYCYKIHAVSDEKARNSENVTEPERSFRTLAIERHRDKTSRRYIVDESSRLQTVYESLKEDKTMVNGGPMFISQRIRDFILPAGFPGSVADDYLEYMFWQFPTNVTAWVCRTLVTSSLLKAVGVGSLPYSAGTAATTAAASAAIKWVSKDGVGSLGRLFIGGQFGGLFDNDPKQWRMYADFIGSAGSIFELATPLFPEYFLLLASLGNLTKAVARGLKDPSFRVIQNHFATSGNLGDVAAKEEVWEVGGQICGLAIGVLILAAPGLVTSYPNLALTWTSLRLLHLWLRYQSLARLRFCTINLKRARILVERYLSNIPVPGVDECNKEEDILRFERLIQPCIRFGCSLEMLIGTEDSGGKLETLLDIYKNERYILDIHSSPFHEKEARVAFKDGATGITVLRSIWQTYWLYVKGDVFNDKSYADCPDLLSKEGLSKAVSLTDCLRASLQKMDDLFDDFLHQIYTAEWDVNSLKVPSKVLIVEHEMADQTDKV